MAVFYRKFGCCLFLALSPLLLILVIALGCNLWVVWSTGDRIFRAPAEVENRSVALVLGTSKKVAPNTPNPHFENRIDAAVELHRLGKVEHILVSGYRDSRYYDEAQDMRKRLIEHGIPEEVIMHDDKGNRTLDSIERSLEVHDVDTMVIVSDGFHVHRALFIADRRGIDAIGLASRKVAYRHSVQTRFREYFARVKAVMDLYLINPEVSSRMGRWFEDMLNSNSNSNSNA